MAATSGLLVDMAEEEPVAASAGHLVDAPQHLGVERVADVPDDHAEQRAAAPAQRSGEEVRLVAEVGCGGEDPRARLCRDRDTRLAPFRIRETVVIETPARSATWRSVIVPPTRFVTLSLPPLDTADYRSCQTQTSRLIVKRSRQAFSEPREPSGPEEP